MIHTASTSRVFGHFVFFLACLELLLLSGCRFGQQKGAESLSATTIRDVNALNANFYGQGPTGPYCLPASDQVGSFLAPLEKFEKVQIHVDKRFDDQQIAAIERAVSTWNHFGQSQMSRTFFEIKVEDSLQPFSSALAAGENGDECNFDSPDHGFRIAINDSPLRWKALGLTSSNPAVTLRCKQEGKFLKQIIMVDPQLAVPEQWESILLHELGHAVGLNHSCAPEAALGYAGCHDLPEGHDYKKAIMYPSLKLIAKPGTGNTVDQNKITFEEWAVEKKESIQFNDEERVKCLYY